MTTPGSRVPGEHLERLGRPPRPRRTRPTPSRRPRRRRSRPSSRPGRGGPSPRGRPRARPRPGARRRASARCRPALPSSVRFMRATSARCSSEAERVAFDELVDVRQRRRHAPGERRELGRRLQRVHPHDAVRDPARGAPSARRAPRGRRGPSRRRGSTTTAPRAMPRTPHSSLNCAQALAEPGAARPVDHPLRPRPRWRRRGRATRARG